MTVTVDSLDVVLATRIPRGKNRGARLSDIVDGGAEGERWLARRWHRLCDGDDA